MKNRDWRKTGREYVRYKVRERDKFTCRKCDKPCEKGKRQFDVHHTNGLCGKKSRGYDSVEKMRGLITLCHKCHCQTHMFKKNVRKRANISKPIARRLRGFGWSYDRIGKKYGVSSAAIYWALNGRKPKV